MLSSFINLGQSYFGGTEEVNEIQEEIAVNAYQAYKNDVSEANIPLIENEWVIMDGMTTTEGFPGTFDTTTGFIRYIGETSTVFDISYSVSGFFEPPLEGPIVFAIWIGEIEKVSTAQITHMDNKYSSISCSANIILNTNDIITLRCQLFNSSADGTLKLINGIMKFNKVGFA